MILALVPFALAELPWECPEMAVPADARALDTDAGLAAILDDLEAEALSWTAGCAWTSTPTDDGTVETCLTDAGGKFEVETTVLEEYDGYDTCTTETWSLTATLPAGATTWTAMALARSETSCPWSGVSDASATWSGTFGDLPPDASFGLYAFSSSDYFGYMSGRQASTPACSWGVFDSWPWEGEYHSAWTSEHSVDVATEYGCGEVRTYATMDDVLVGAVHPDTWELLADDLDVDGWSAEGGDCDDGDAAVHPCAADPAEDGLDQDCDGADEVDADDDGWTSDWDCDDGDPARNPDATELPCDGVDQDCDRDDACPGHDEPRDTDAEATPPVDDEEDPRTALPVRQIAEDDTGGCRSASSALLFLPLVPALARRRRRP